jgi:hypothetical protein
MEEDQNQTKKILYHAYRCLLFNEMMINQSETWLSEEEGNENMMREIKARRRKEGSKKIEDRR